MKKSISLLSLAALFTLSAFAQNSDVLPNNYLAGMHVKHQQRNPALQHKRGNIPSPHGFPVGVDTLVNFTGHYEAQGVLYNGAPHQMWEYSMVGNAPQHGGTTTINAPVVPVTVDMRNADGSPRYVVTDTSNCPACTPSELGKTVRLISSPDSFLQQFLQGPVFGKSSYSSSPVPTQITDAIQRAEFGKQARADWHTLLAPRVKTERTMVLNEGSYYFALNDDGTCCAFVLVSDPVFGSQLFPSSTPDNSTVIGAAEVAGDITTKDMSTFFFPNVYLYENNDPSQCCVLGYHTFDYELGNASNGNRPQFYVLNYSSWISPGLFGGGFEDVTAHSHEVAETFNDPFVGFDNIHNVTPFWLNPAGQCQDILEVGDVIEDLPNPTYPVTINGYTYHPQTEALLPWFEFQKNSSAIDNAYSYPNENVLTSLSAPQPLNCGGN